jgi:hypothetical protein
MVRDLWHDFMRKKLTWKVIKNSLIISCPAERLAATQNIQAHELQAFPLTLVYGVHYS